jgi:hypothetical protein
LLDVRRARFSRATILRIPSTCTGSSSIPALVELRLVQVFVRVTIHREESSERLVFIKWFGWILARFA